MENIKDFCIIYVSTDSLANAKLISNALLIDNLAACCSIIPNVTSIYKWKDKITTDEEFIIMIKSSMEKFQDIEDRINKLHNYDIPEIICTPIESGSEKYLQWMKDILEK